VAGEIRADRSATIARDVVNALRALTMDAVQAAGSGHPGMPMGMAEIAEVLWRRHLRHNPANPGWYDRDRFVLSNGHGSMLLYSVLHLTGYDLPIDELQRFRQLRSRTPGHPEVSVTPGVETTTGPLGQGLANAVGMALAEKLLAAEFNRPDFPVVDHYTYVFLGDGCLMEGISHEACSLAGTLGLGKLICLYDDNGISIDGQVDGWFTDDTPMRFRAYGWHVIDGVDGHDSSAVDAALEEAKRDRVRPTLICCKTVIGQGAPNRAGTHDVHGAPLGAEEVAAAREHLGWSYPPFEIPRHVYEAWGARASGERMEAAWRRLFHAYGTRHPELAAELSRRLRRDLGTGWGELAAAMVPTAAASGETVATRKASQRVLEQLGPVLPELLGGSADLTGSNLTSWSGSRPVHAEPVGNYVHYGVREFGMAAIVNGIALHGGFIPYAGTFLTFSDYSRNALRMAALMGIRSIHVFSHDSIGLGEDGPTHQAVEQAASLRLIPNMDVWRPCDALETAVAWKAAIERRTGPTSLLLSRQGLPSQERSPEAAVAIERGGYVLVEPDSPPVAVILATGSEVAIAVEAQGALAGEGVPVRVVSIPSTTVWDRQPVDYRATVLPPDLPVVAVEAGVTEFWRKYVGRAGAVVGIDRFGESAPAEALFTHFGFTAARVAEAVRTVAQPRAGAPSR
jgi:transketolase